MAEPAFDPSLHTHRVKEFFLARQPILNRDQSLAAYELLFRSAAAGPANVTDDLAATASVIAHASELGMENVIGTSRGFVNVDAAVLLSDIILFLPKDKIVLEILETVKVTPALINRVAELAKEGYVFALDDVIADSNDVQQLLPLVEIIKVDIVNMESADLVRLATQFKTAKKKLLAEKVENVEQFQQCLDLGFDYFQGYYFAKPVVLTGKKLSPSQLAIMQLIALIVSDADTAEIERTIKQDASLGLTLLRLVNTPAAGVTQRIDSLGQALLVLGRRQLQRWLQILLYANPGKSGSVNSPLLVLATTRGKLLELMAQHLYPGNRNKADTAFTVGIMSLMDTLFGLPMEKILEQISVVDEVSQALLSRTGPYGDMLQLVQCIEHIKESGPQVAELLQKLDLPVEDFNALQIAAFEWSDSIAGTAG
ncbi:MAG TPA: EAL domain-containing protein [Noviherbaspirillum sp.]|jgi:EAL and modified HD-GYP domain-containing signal transduction protein|uniref:EAL and HDOD domain-containing protein n=1 Tax=Noviherbaspirillum sp. TaxID=1926288 RepID=UPI002DDD34D0|nr:EAL domain-containing protein [Noviherbaspirillum sp.]HEV2612812.1 EAL domain-containing protein [Noviherbaspirillum sp.]